MHAVSPCCSHCQHLNSRLSCAQGPLQAVFRIRIRTDPYYMAGSVSDDTDQDLVKADVLDALLLLKANGDYLFKE